EAGLLRIEDRSLRLALAPGVGLELDGEVNGHEAVSAVGPARDVAEAPDDELAERDVTCSRCRDERHRETRRDGAHEQIFGAPDAVDPTLELRRRRNGKRGLARHRRQRQLALE